MLTCLLFSIFFTKPACTVDQYYTIEEQKTDSSSVIKTIKNIWFTECYVKCKNTPTCKTFGYKKVIKYYVDCYLLRESEFEGEDDFSILQATEVILENKQPPGKEIFNFLKLKYFIGRNFRSFAENRSNPRN